MSAGRLSFWFEFASTYSYLTVMRIGALAARHDVEIEWRPFLLGPIFADQGWTTSPFNLYPVKGRYMWHDVARRARALGIGFHRPDPFPQNSVLAARVALLALKTPHGVGYCRAVFKAEFADGCSIADPAVLRRLLADTGLDPDLVDQAGDPAGKQALRDAVDDAKALGIFGAPSFVAGEELFWGDDRLEAAIAFCHQQTEPTQPG